MIDTGAAKTAIDDGLLTGLALTPMRYDQVVGVSQHVQECPVYLIQLGLSVIAEGQRAEYFLETEALSVPVPTNGEPYSGFLGRDFLAHWRLTYDGPSGAVEMQIER
jgi:hypothetical protein